MYQGVYRCVWCDEKRHKRIRPTRARQMYTLSLSQIWHVHLSWQWTKDKTPPAYETYQTLATLLL